MSVFAEFATPRTRPREDDDESDFTVSVDGDAPAELHSNKRPRLDEPEHEDDEVSETQEGDLLPNSFRRSPKGKERAVNGRPNGHAMTAAPQKHQPGSIVRVKLTDFVTYTRAEFHPGPNLNMIIGPNGTGKSTLVCAICLGLGWATSHLGRAKDIGEFVKHGSKRAEIEIELAADPERHVENPIVRTRITKDGNKVEYFISDKKSNKKGVQDLARSFSIQVDNLCQFLPQDRVVEFAALSPVDLLTQTQRAAAPEYVSQWHEELKELRRQQKKQQTEQQNVMETLKTMEERHRVQEADVARIREREKLKERIAAMEKLRPFPAYQEARRKHLEAKTRQKEASKELRELQRRVAPNLRASELKQGYVERIEKVVRYRSRLVERSGATVNEAAQKIKAADEKIHECTTQIDAEKESVKAIRQSIPRLRQEIARIDRAMQDPPEEFDAADLNAQIREKTRLYREVEVTMEELKLHSENLATQIGQRAQIIKDKEREKQGLRSQAGQQANKLKRASNDAAQVWAWVQNNANAFQGKVYGPPIVECTLTDPRHAAAVESMIPDGDKLAFTVTSQADLRTLLDKVSEMRLRDVNIRVSNQPMSAFQEPAASQQLQQYGLEGWLSDLLNGPDAVLAMLCDNRSIHQMAYTTGDISEAQFNLLKTSAIGSWVTRTQSYQITRRREYGEGAVSTRVQALKQPRFFTDVPVDRQLEQDIETAVRELRGEIEELSREKDQILSRGKALGVERAQHNDDRKAIEEEKRRKQLAFAEFQGLSVKLEAQQGKLAKAQDDLVGFRERVGVIRDRGDKLHLEKGQLALDYANAVDSLRNLHMQLFEIEIMHIEAKSDYEQLVAQHAEEVRLVAERTREVEVLRVDQTRLHEEGRVLAQQCHELGQTFSEVDTEVFQMLEGGGEQGSGQKWSSEQLETEIQSFQARFEMTHGGGNANTINEFERRESNIRQSRGRLTELDAAIDVVTEKITEIRGQWEPQLDALVGKISEAFKENFDKIDCAGEVAVHKDDEFEQWAIQIRVKFRETEQLSVLDSHRQSGGERAVSTIFYLMALQSLARAPFRVVDEINQGMDPRNERLVHSRMVDIACADAEDGRQGSQYFLITPKLLSGLKYHPNMKVHCIASGEYMPADHRELDFGALADKALALRNARAGGMVSAAG